MGSEDFGIFLGVEEIVGNMELMNAEWPQQFSACLELNKLTHHEKIPSMFNDECQCAIPVSFFLNKLLKLKKKMNTYFHVMFIKASS